MEGRTSCHLSAHLGSLAQSFPMAPCPPHSALLSLEKHLHCGIQQRETTMGAGIWPRPRGGPVMAARALPTSAQVSIWFNIKETVQVSCGHLAWAVQPPPASAVLATRSLLFLTPAHCPQLPLMAQGHPHSCPGAEGQTVSAAGDLLQSPCVPPVLSQVPLP